MSTVRLLPLIAPAGAGVVVTTGGATTILSLIGAVVTLLLARTVVHRLRDAVETESRTRR